MPFHLIFFPFDIRMRFDYADFSFHFNIGIDVIWVNQWNNHLISWYVIFTELYSTVTNVRTNKQKNSINKKEFHFHIIESIKIDLIVKTIKIQTFWQFFYCDFDYFCCWNCQYIDDYWKLFYLCHFPTFQQLCLMLHIYNRLRTNE